MIPLIEGSFIAGQKKNGAQYGFDRIRKIVGNDSRYRFFPLKPFLNPTFDFQDESFWLRKLYGMTLSIIQDEDTALILGGDHTISLATAAAALRAHPDTAVVWIDAHADFNTYASSLTKNLHGMSLQALVNGGDHISSAFSWLKPVLAPEKTALIGLRSVDPLEQKLLDQQGISYWTMEVVRQQGLEKTLRQALKKLNSHGTTRIHLSLDTDAFAPKEFPQTGLPVSGGFHWEEVEEILFAFAPHTMDIVEWNPLLEGPDCLPQMLRLIQCFQQIRDFRKDLVPAYCAV